MEKYIISHKSPDTDTICSSIIYSRFLEKKNIKTKVIKLGELNNETKFVLNRFRFEEPKTKLKLKEESQIILMDHNEAKQSIDNRDKYKIVQIIDHHKMNFSTKEPLFVRAEPIGSTCSIVAKMFFEENLELNKYEASLLISAIISDTLYFRSPTTTKEDIELVKKLNKIAKIENLEEYALEMFEKKSDLGNISIQDLIKLDYKEFNISGKKFGIGVMETTNPNFALEKIKKIKEKEKKIIKDDNLDYIIFSIIDILNEINYTIVPDENHEKLLKGIFNAQKEKDYLNLKKILSRKKQIVPRIEKYFN